MCTTCGRAFTRRDHLLRHSSRCTPKPFVCGVCRSSFTRERDLDRHTNTVRCGAPPQPEPAPKRQKVTHLREDPLTPPPVEHAANDNLSRDLRDFVHENWASVRTHVVNGPVQTRYNHRLTSLDTRDLQEPLFVLFDQQKTAFKVNVSYGFVLKEKQSGRLRYYHSSSNCCGRLLEEPSLIANRDDFDRFLARIAESDIQQWARDQRPDSDWVCEHVTNVGGKVHGRCTVTKAFATLMSTVSIKVMYIVRRRRYSNSWTTRVSLSTKRCGTTPTERRSISNAVSTSLIFHRTVIRCSGWHDTIR